MDLASCTSFNGVMDNEVEPEGTQNVQGSGLRRLYEWKASMSELCTKGGGMVAPRKHGKRCMGISNVCQKGRHRAKRVCIDR